MAIRQIPRNAISQAGGEHRDSASACLTSLGTTEPDSGFFLLTVAVSKIIHSNIDTLQDMYD